MCIILQDYEGFNYILFLLLELMKFVISSILLMHKYVNSQEAVQ